MPVTGQDPDAEYVSAEFALSEYLKLKLAKDTTLRCLFLPVCYGKGGSRFCKMNIGLEGTYLVLQIHCKIYVCVFSDVLVPLETAVGFWSWFMHNQNISANVASFGVL